MRRAVLAVAVCAAGLVVPAAAGASLDCEPIGPVPGYGPVCSVQCSLDAVHPGAVPAALAALAGGDANGAVQSARSVYGPVVCHDR